MVPGTKRPIWCQATQLGISPILRTKLGYRSTRPLFPRDHHLKEENMPRPHRPLVTGGWYHVTNRGAARQDIFLSNADRAHFLDLLGDAVWLQEIEIHAYCLMGNHYHLLVRTPNGNLDRALHRAMSIYVRKFNERHGRDGPLFKARYFSSLIEDESYLLAASRYIHRNPIEFGVSDLASYRWSSYRQFLNRRLRNPWLSTNFTLGLSGGVRGYEAFVEGPLGGAVDYVAAVLRDAGVPGTAA